MRLSVSAAKRLLVSTSPFEVRAALLEDGLVAEIFLERTRLRGVAGNMYKGRVRKILPGMQSAFVDIGLDRDAFLHVSDIVEPRSLEESPDPAEVASDSAPAALSISELLTEGEDIVVQVAKEAMGSKGARVTTHVTLAGRYVVYMPTVDHLGVSRRIESEAERARLKGVVERLRSEVGAGFIVRTAGADRAEADILEDGQRLHRLWSALRDRTASLDAPQLLQAELGLVDRLLRDVAGPDLAEIVVDDDRDYERCVSFLAREQPELAGRVSRHMDPVALFEAYGVEAEIERALRSKVWLKSGGYIVINQTEALVSIDVNTGRYVGKVNLEDTVLRTNLEAVREIVRQIRLRDLGGIIVLDFIDMEESQNRERVVADLERELQRDRSKSKILQISDFGLVEMTRKRVKESLERLLCRPCASCAGSGRVKSAETVCFMIHRELLKSRRTLPGGPIELRVHPDVAATLLGSERDVIRDLEDRLSAEILVIADPGFEMEQFDFMAG